MDCRQASRNGGWLLEKPLGLLLVVATLSTVCLVQAQGPQNPPRPPQGFPGDGQIQYLPQGIVAVNNIYPSPGSYSQTSPASSSPGSPSSASGASPGSPGNSPGSTPPSAGGSASGSPPPAAGSPAEASPSPAAAVPAPPAEAPAAPLQPDTEPQPGQTPAAPGAALEPQAVDAAGSTVAAAALSQTPATALVPGPLAPAPAQQQPPVRNLQATRLDGVVQLQGEGLWPFDDRMQGALVSALAAAMPGIPQNQVKIEEAVQAAGTGSRLSQAATLVNVHFQAQAADAGGAASARDQLQAAASAGNLAAAMRSQDVTVDSVRVLSADLIAPPTQPQPSPAGVNTAAIAGGVTAAVVVLAAGTGIALWCFLRRRGTQQDVVEPAEPEYRADPFYCGSIKTRSPEVAQHKAAAGSGPQQEQIIAMTDTSHAAVMGLSGTAGDSSQPTPLRSRASTPSFVSHSRNSSAISAQVQATIDQLRSHADELSRPTTPGLAGAQDAGATAKPLVLTPNANMDMHGRIAAANSQLSAFTASLTAETAAPTVSALLSSRAANRRKLAVAGATGSKVMKLNDAMQNLTECSRFADKYEVQSARIAGDSCIVASGKQLSSGCAVVLKFFVDEDDFLHLKRFHHQARDAQYIPGVLDIFEAGETALGSGASPACIVSEAGQYSLAHYLAKMERNPSAARQKSTLTQLLEAVSYLHGRSMVHREVQPDSCVWCDSVSRWRFAGSQTWARKGTDAALSYNLRYAAPEVVMADALGVATRLKMSSHPAAAEGQEDGSKAQGASSWGPASSAAALTQGPVLHVTQAASDMWAVGALAWELLTGRPLFGDAFLDEDVVMALLGFKPLPFEADPSLWVLFTESQAAVLLQGLLARRPEQRLTVSKALHIMASLEDSH